MSTEFSFKSYMITTANDDISSGSVGDKTPNSYIKEEVIPKVWSNSQSTTPTQSSTMAHNYNSGDKIDNDQHVEIDDEFDDQDMTQDDEDTNDPNLQGIIRVVKGAHLVFKRKTEDGYFEELWIYNINNQNIDELDVRRDILSSTDIPRHENQSEDGIQSYEVWTPGDDVQFLLVTGLPQ